MFAPALYPARIFPPRLFPRRTGPAAEELPEDLLAAVVAAFHAGPLAALFGETDPEWRPKVRREDAEPGDEPPYAVIGLDAEGPHEPLDFHGVVEQGRRLWAEVYAATDAQASALARGFREYFTLAGGAGEIEWADGIATEREADAGDPEPLRTQDGPGGRRVRGRRVRITFTVQFQAYGSGD